DSPGTPDATDVDGESITISWAPPTHDAPSNISMPIKCAEPTEEPDAPSIVNVTDTTNTSVSLEWTRPAYDGGMEIHGYIIEMCKGSEQEWHRVNEDLCAVTKYNVTGLETGAEYKFRICAVNSVGKGEAKEIPESVQAVDRLLAPEIDIDASFKQTHIVKSGGSVCIRIGFKGKPTPTASWTKVDGELGVMTDITTTETFTALTLENCTRNDTGKYTLTLENSSGNKSITIAVKVLDTPGVPGALSIKEVTRGALTIAWKPPTNDGGARVHHYIVEKREASRRTWTEAAPKTTQTSLRVSDLLEGVPYFFRVVAENQYGLGEAYEMPDPVIATAEPAPPKRVDIIDTTDTSATLVCGRPAPKVSWKLEEMRLKETDRVSIKTTKNRTTLTVKDCMRGDGGRYFLTLENVTGSKTFTVTATLLSASHILSLEKVAGLSVTTLMLLTQISLSLHWEKERNMNSV
uniref:Titin n=1 Tax=Sinocyclocheilus anshuiensis TaxID=1608454 RepID=A0A671KI08_9TELE